MRSVFLRKSSIFGTIMETASGQFGTLAEPIHYA